MPLVSFLAPCYAQLCAVQLRHLIQLSFPSSSSRSGRSRRSQTARVLRNHKLARFNAEESGPAIQADNCSGRNFSFRLLIHVQDPQR